MTELLDAYKNTNYKINNTDLVIKIGVKNERLDALLRSLNATTWAFITAFNPYSKELSKAENLSRHEELKTKMANYTVYEGEGAGEDKSWTPETSLLIIGISQKEAIATGNYFEQNAIVVGEINGIPELKILTSI